MNPPSIEAQVHALKEVINALRDVVDERDERYKIQFVTLGQAAELNNKAVSIAMDAADKAVQKAESAVEKRFESVNEFRAQMGDMQDTFARTDMMMSKFDSIQKKIDELAEYQIAQAAGMGALGKLWGFVIGFIGLAIGVAAFFWPKGGGP